MNRWMKRRRHIWIIDRWLVDGKIDRPTAYSPSTIHREANRKTLLCYFYPINISKHFNFALSDTCPDKLALRLRMGSPCCAPSSTITHSSCHVGPRIKAHTHTKPSLCDDRVLRTYPQRVVWRIRSRKVLTFFVAFFLFSFIWLLIRHAHARPHKCAHTYGRPLGSQLHLVVDGHWLDSTYNSSFELSKLFRKVLNWLQRPGSM